MFDVIIRGGRVIDGTGATRVRTDVGITAGKISALGEMNGHSCALEINASGKIVCPGFIDSHAHSEISVLAQPDAAAKIRQGVTTEVVGNCGFSAFPLAEKTKAMARSFSQPVLGHAEIEWDWADASGYFERLKRQGSAINIATLVGHGTLRNAVLGFEKRAPTAAELAEMQRLLEQSMQQGACGLSTGLCYVPGAFAETEEIVELCRVVSQNHGIYATHLRDQSDRLEIAVEEALDIGSRARVPVLISHHKAAGSRNWGKVEKTLAMLDAAESAGTKTWSDAYPYVAGQSTMLSVLPPWVVEGGVEAMLDRLRDGESRRRIKRDFESSVRGWENRAAVIGWENVIISSAVTAKNRDIVGLSVQAAASRRETQPIDFLIDLLLDEGGMVGKQSIQCCEEDVLRVLTHERTMVGSDGLDVENPHPRQYGCFARVLGEYVRERKALSLETAIYKMTGLTASAFGFSNVGLIRPGMRADVTIFDPQTIAERGTFSDPCRHPQGIEWVLVGGVPAVASGEPTGARNGVVVRRGQNAPPSS